MGINSIRRRRSCLYNRNKHILLDIQHSFTSDTDSSSSSFYSSSTEEEIYTDNYTKDKQEPINLYIQFKTQINSLKSILARCISEYCLKIS